LQGHSQDKGKEKVTTEISEDTEIIQRQLTGSLNGAEDLLHTLRSIMNYKILCVYPDPARREDFYRGEC
jgi:hypothetical protein